MSLYPSIMRAHNLCHSTHVLDPTMQHLDGVNEYDIGAEGRRGIEVRYERRKNCLYESFLSIPASFLFPSLPEPVYFVSSARHKGILPRILEELHAQRKAAKGKVKEYAEKAKRCAQADADGSALASALSRIWDGRQLALKVERGKKRKK